MNASTSFPAPDELVNATDVEAAARKLQGIVTHTPLQLCPRLSELTGARIWLKREDLQPVRSYKLRGAYHFLSALDESARQRAVVAASAGNHAQGVAYACRLLGLTGRIYVPSTTPRQKRDRIRTLGSDRIELVVVGETFDDAAEAAHADAQQTAAVLVPPFDHDLVIAGQGTVAMEAVEDLRREHGREAHTFVVPVGGGGLLAGCGAWLRERMPSARIVAVEPSGAVSMAAALRADRPVTLHDIDRFVDGAAVRRVGERTFASAKAITPDMVSVDEGAVCTQMLQLYQVEGVIAEPAGALAAAAVATGAARIEPDTDVIVVVTGGNNDVSRYSEVLERSLVHEGLKHYFLVTFPQEPGALRRFLDQVLGPDDDIVLFDYIKRNNRETGPALVGLEISRKEDLDPLLTRMLAVNMDIERIDPTDPIYRYLT
ncbi:threonine ammonia-lyase IlvA [Devriesea agamarum]|uniref:threonine ammonia-lyase IlvA n=1 Tax=Devriesea agamarum TaxID=472569 RepID=UPI00071D36AC|nr:threonine ammonia-lyase IlvA [Devriesea agamarum]